MDIDYLLRERRIQFLARNMRHHEPYTIQQLQEEVTKKNGVAGQWGELIYDDALFYAIELQKAELLIDKQSKRPIYVDATGTSTQIRSNVDALRAMIRFQSVNGAIYFKEVLKKVREITTGGASEEKSMKS